MSIMIFWIITLKGVINIVYEVQMKILIFSTTSLYTVMLNRAKKPRNGRYEL